MTFKINGFRRYLSNWFYKGQKNFWFPARHLLIPTFPGVRKTTHTQKIYQQNQPTNQTKKSPDATIISPTKINK